MICTRYAQPLDGTLLCRVALGQSSLNEPTCTSKGVVEYTCECGEAYIGYIDAIGHIDEDGDFICDNCGKEFNCCTQMCHSNNPVAQFVWKIIITICKFFGIAKNCSCGRAHY